MLLPSVKSCLKYQFLEQIDEQCRDLCVRKQGNNGPSVLHVPRNNTKSSLEELSWDAIIEEMQERAPDLLDFISTVSVPVLHENGNQVPPVCVAYGQMMHTRWRELSLVQKVITFILGIGHSTRKVNLLTQRMDSSLFYPISELKPLLSFLHIITRLTQRTLESNFPFTIHLLNRQQKYEISTDSDFT